MCRFRAAVVAALLVTVFAAPAAAHVTVNPHEAEQGGYAKLAFRVPNERDDSGTTKVEVFFPAELPFASVSVKPVPGWTATVEKQKLEKPIGEDEDAVTEAVSKIVWTGGEIAPGEFQEFEVSAGPMPEDAEQILFKAIQTYADGEVVRWIDEPAEEGDEPEHPAPVLQLVEGSGGHHGGGTDDAEEDPEEAAVDGEAASAPAEEVTNGVESMAAVALILALVALVVSGAVLARPRPSAS